MKGSQELIEYFDMREKALGEKATKFNMFLEGYVEGYKDTKEFLIDKACEWLKENIYDYIAVGNTDFGKPYDIDLCDDELFDDFRKALEEDTK